MYTVIFTSRSLSDNQEVRRSQVIQIIKDLRDIWKNQKYSNEIFYTFHHLKFSLDYWNKELTRINKKLIDSNLNNSQCFLPL